MRRIYFTFVSLFFIASVTNAQDVQRLSMKDCMDYALKHNYSIKNAQLDVLIQHIQNNETLSASYPHINGKVEFDDFDIPQKSFFDASNFDKSLPKGSIGPVSFTVPFSTSVGITTSQLLFDGAVFVAWKARNTVMELAKQTGAVTEENVRYNVYKAYNSLVIAYRQYEIIKSSLAYARSLEHDLKVTRRNGFAEQIEVDRTSVQVNNLATDSIRIGNLLKVSENLLKYQIGMNMSTDIILTDTNVEQHKLDAMDMLTLESNYERVPEYNLAHTSLLLNEFNLTRYKLTALPSLSTFWAYGYNYGSDHLRYMFNKLNKYEPSSTIGIQLNMPIYNGSLRTNQVHETQLNIEKSKNNIELAKQTIDFQVVTSRTNLKNAILQVQSQKRNMELSNRVLDLAQKKYKGGVGSNLEVTQAQTDVLRSQTNYFSALLDLINGEADLKKALGLLK